MKKILSIIIALCSITLVSCDKETEGISKLTAFPEFKMEGAAFMNVKLDPTGTFTDPGVKAFVGDEEYPVKVTGTVNIQEKGLYTLNYETVSKEGFPVTTSRMVLVTPELVQNDYSGTYTLVHATRKKQITVDLVTGELGYYKASDCWWQATAIPLYFLDMGGTELLVLTNSCAYGPISVVGTVDVATNTIKFDAVFTGGVNAGVTFSTSWVKE